MENDNITAEQTEMAKGPLEEFFNKNKEGIQYVDIPARIYYISRKWTLRGPIPAGVRIEHTGIIGTHNGRVSKKVATYDTSRRKRT